jgi:hypothetical protein
VKDIPNDQGGRVKLSWDASTYDTQAPTNVDHYWIFRSVPPQVATASGSKVGEIVAGRVQDARFYSSQFRASTYYWELLSEVRAIHFIQGYSYVAATTGDSLPTSNPVTLFMVMALDSSNTSHWDSAPDSGYSVDNLAPAAPTSLTGSYSSGATHLHWVRNAEADLTGYRVYRGPSASFIPSSANLLASPPDTGFVDSSATGSYYKVSAVDVHGNESLFALLTPAGTVSTPGSEGIFALARPTPNPARGEMEFGFTLPAAGIATLKIFDGRGRQIDTPVHGPCSAGPQSVRWTGRDGEGRAIPAGVYFAKLDALGRTMTVRFAVLR